MPSDGSSRSLGDYPTVDIRKPGPHDVLCGRGGGTNNFAGNVNFRKLVSEHKMRYLAASKVDKPKVAREVVKLWRALEPPGRFLARTGGAKAGPATAKDTDALWHDVGNKKAREKASQCLRERTPEVMPYVKQLQASQKKPKEAEITNTSSPSESSASFASDGSPVGGLAGGELADHDAAYLGGEQQNPSNPGAVQPQSEQMKTLAMLRQQQMELQAKHAYLLAQQQKMSQGTQLNGAGAAPASPGVGGGGGTSLSGITPEMAAAFGIDPEMLQTLQAAAASQGIVGPDNISSQFVVAPSSAHHSQSSSGFNNTNANSHPGWTTFAQNENSFGGMGDAGLEDFNFAQFQRTTQETFHSHRLGGEVIKEEDEGYNSDEMTLEEYQRSLEDYIAKEVGDIVVKDDDDSGDEGVPIERMTQSVEQDRRLAMEEQRRSSWVKSFHSVDTQSMASITSQSIKEMGGIDMADGSGGGSGRTLGKSSTGSISSDQVDLVSRSSSSRARGERDQQLRISNASGATFPSANLTPEEMGMEIQSRDFGDGDHPQMPPPTGATRSGRLSITRQNIPDCGASIFSEASLFSTGMSTVGDKSRSSKMSASKHLRSDISMMSELTDLSDAASKMSIGR